MSDEPTRRGFKPRPRRLTDEEIAAAATRDLEELADDKQFGKPPEPVALSDGAPVAAPAPQARTAPRTPASQALERGDDGPDVHLQVRLPKLQRQRFLSAVKLEGTSAQAVIGEFVKTYLAKRERRGES